MANRIQLRRGGAQEWANSNPTLAQGELGIELDTGRFKIGDGVSAWNSLRYERPVESTSNTANTLVQRDADGNFAAATITSTLIGNASTATRLASTRQIQLSDDVQGSGVFDGSSNLNLVTSLELVTTLPHYDGTSTSTGTYTKVTVDAKGRISNASTPTTLAAYGLDGTVEGSSAMPYDGDLAAIAGITTTGLIARTSANVMATRTLQGSTSRIAITDGSGIGGNPTIDLITTAVTPADYNTASLTSVAGSQTVNTTTYTVDDYGRLTASADAPIATAVEGTEALAYNAATVYVRDDKITNGGNLYQAILGIAAGQGAPTHTDSTDAGSWRYLAAVSTKQKGLASFAQEDFDVAATGHVTIAADGVDNSQLQNKRIGFADGNSVENFELDQELTATTGYRGFNYLNYAKVNDTSGNLLFGANNTGDGGAGEVDINVRQYWSDPDITLDGGVNQTIDKTGDGNLTIQSTQDSASNRTVSIFATNLGTGESHVIIGAEDKVSINANDANGKVHVENLRFQGNYLGGTGDILIDPNDDRDITGLVTIRGNLQVDGTTTTVNSTVTTLDDPIITLGGDTAPASDDSKDRGVEFRYYDSSAKVGFFGYDDSANDLGGHSGTFTFLYDATNTSEVFAGTDAGIIAGNLKLTTNTNSTSNTTGDLVVAGGAGIGDDVNIGGSVDIDTNLVTHGTGRFNDSVTIQGASKTLQLNNGSGTTRVELQSTTGNASFYGVVDITNNLNINSNKFNVVAASGNTAIAGTLTVSDATTIKADAKYFKIQTAAAVDKFTIDTDNGDTDSAGKLNVADLVHFESTDNPDILSGAPHTIQNSDYGALRVDGGAYFDKNVLFNGDLYLNGDFNQQEDATENYGLRNYLSVRYKLRAGSVGAYTPSYSNHNTSNLRVFGGAGVNTTLHVGGTGSGEGLFVGKKASGDTVKFSVLGATGNTDIQGTLDVAGNTEINGTLDVDADFAVRTGTTDKFTVASTSGNTVIEGTLNTKLAADFDTTLNVDGAATFGDDVTFQDNNKIFKIKNGFGSDCFTVDYDYGDTTIMRDLTVGSVGNRTTTEFIGRVLIGGNLTNDYFQVNDTSGNLAFHVNMNDKNATLTGNTSCSGGLGVGTSFSVDPVANFDNTTQQDISGSFSMDGAVRLDGGLGVTKQTAFGADVRCYADLIVTQECDFNGGVDVAGLLNVSSTQDAATLNATASALKSQGGLTVQKKTWIGGDFTVYDAGNGRNAFKITNSTGDATLHNDLTVGGNLIVNGTTTTVNSTVTTLDDPIITLGGDTAPSSDDAKDRGVEFRYYDSSAKIGFFGFDNSSNQFAFLTDATNTSEVHAGTDGALRAGSLNLTGAGTALDVDNNVNIDGTLTVDGQGTFQVADGTAPFVITSTTKVNNLNVDRLDNMTTASANTASTVVNRDSSGDFAANQITAASAAGAGAGCLGNATSADAWKTARVLTLDGVVDGNVSIDGSAAVTLTTTFNDTDISALAAQSGTGYVVRTGNGTYAQRTLQATASSGITLTNADGVSGDTTINVASASTNASNNLVLRDGSGNFAANVITASLTGDVTGNLVAATSTAKDLNPAADSTYDLGTTSVRWQGIYADAANITAITGDLTGTADIATTVTVADEQTDTTCNVLFATDATGNLGVKSRSTFLFNAANGRVTAPSFGGAFIGNADTATKFYSSKTIGGVAFDGSANIDLAGVNISGTQDTSGNAATATALAASVNIGGVAFDGTASISLPGVNTAGNQDTSGTAGSATQATNLNNHNTAALAEGTNLYYTEARVQAKLDNAFEQLSAMLNNLATSTTLVLNLSGDPTPGSVTTIGSITASGLGGYSNASGVATTGGTGSGLTVNTTVDGNGAITGLALNAAGSDYLITDTLTLTNPNLGGVSALNLGTLAGGTGYTTATGVATSSSGSGTGATLNITASGGAIINVSVNNAGSGYAIGETLTITNANATGIKTLGSIATAGTGYSAGSGIATTGSNTSATVDITVDGNGAVTGVTINDDGTGYAVSDTVTIVNANATGVNTLGSISNAGTGWTEGTFNNVATTSSGSGTGLTLNVTADASGNVTAVTVNTDGSGYANSEVISIVGGNDDAQTSVAAIHGNSCTIPVSAIHGNSSSLNTAAVFVNATFTLSDIATMEVGATVTGGTSGSTGVITALGATSVTVDNVDGFFKKGETVGANDVTNLTIQSFA